MGERNQSKRIRERRRKRSGENKMRKGRMRGKRIEACAAIESADQNASFLQDDKR